MNSSSWVEIYNSGGKLINTSTGAYLSTGGTWTNASDRKAKENIEPVDPEAILEGVARLPISTWNYKTQDDSIRHIGPMAQDFYAAFGVGEDERHISTIDADGVALAAIQGLYRLSQEQAARIEALEAENETQQRQIEALQEETAELQEEIEGLREENVELREQIEDLKAQVAALRASADAGGAARPLQSGLLPGFGLLAVLGLAWAWRRGGPSKGGER